MIDNSKLIRDFMTFPNSKSFYFVQILKRRKENAGQKAFSIPIEAFYIYSKEEFDRKMPRIIEKCEQNRARAYVKLNVLDIEDVAWCMTGIIAEYAKSRKWKAMCRVFNSACGRCGKQVGTDKLYLVDLDGDYATPEMKEDVRDFINSLEPTRNRQTGELLPDKVKLEVPTKNGCHFITTGFDMQTFHKAYPKGVVDVHKDGNTILYFPDSCSGESDRFDLEDETANEK